MITTADEDLIARSRREGFRGLLHNTESPLPVWGFSHVAARGLNDQLRARLTPAIEREAARALVARPRASFYEAGASPIDRSFTVTELLVVVKPPPPPTDAANVGTWRLLLDQRGNSSWGGYVVVLAVQKVAR